MDITSYIYRSIGHRIRVRRKAMKLRQTDFDGIDFGILSKIENGKAERSRNPYLLNEYQISILKDKLGYKDIANIVWGTIEEQENFVKMVLLYILISGGEFAFDVIDNPFIDNTVSDALIRWAKKQHCIPKELYKDVNLYIYSKDHVDNKHNSDENTYNCCLKTLNNKEKIISQINTFFLHEYGFFYNHDNYKIYDNYFKNPTLDECKKLHTIADTILKQLLHDYNFAKFYSTCVHNYLFNIAAEKPELNTKIHRFLLHPSTCIDFAFDYINNYNASFIYAFNKNWEKNKDKYITYFDNRLFHNQDIKRNGLRFLSNDYIMKIITAPEFQDICNNISVTDIFFNPEAILATDYYNKILQQLIQTNNLITNTNSNEVFLSHLSSSIATIDKCANIILNKKY